MYKVDKGIPVPAIKKGSPKYPRLEVGESFFVPAKNGDMPKVQNWLLVHGAQTYGSGNATSRQVDGGVRLWRVK